MAPKPLPIRDPERAETEPQHSRSYDTKTGWWTRPTDTSQPTSGQQQGGGDE